MTLVQKVLFLSCWVFLAGLGLAFLVSYGITQRMLLGLMALPPLGFLMLITIIIVWKETRD